MADPHETETGDIPIEAWIPHPGGGLDWLDRDVPEYLDDGEDDDGDGPRAA